MTGSKLTQLEKSLQEDLAAKRVPIAIIACCGSHHTGMVDNLVSVSQLAQRFSCWLHLEGHLISHLCLSDQPKKVTKNYILFLKIPKLFLNRHANYILKVHTVNKV